MSEISKTGFFIKVKAATYSLRVSVLAAGNVLRALLVEQLVKTTANDVQDGNYSTVSSGYYHAPSINYHSG